MEPTLLPPAHLWVSAVSLPRAWHLFCEAPSKEAWLPKPPLLVMDSEDIFWWAGQQEAS